MVPSTDRRSLGRVRDLKVGKVKRHLDNTLDIAMADRQAPPGAKLNSAQDPTEGSGLTDATSNDRPIRVSLRTRSRQ